MSRGCNWPDGEEEPGEEKNAEVSSIITFKDSIFCVNLLVVRRFIAYFLAVFLCVNLYAQGWDAALDRYEQICEECIGLRARAAAGEKIASSEITSLLGQLSSLRKTLSEARGKMTASQMLRYETIRGRYEDAFGERRKTVDAVPYAVPVLPLLPKIPETDRPSPEPSLPPFREPVPLRYGAFIYTSIPDWSLGAMAALSKGRWGGFLKGAFPVGAPRATYDCFSDGTTPSGYIWTSGRERMSRFSITAGATFAPLPFLSVYAGAGYGARTLLWEDAAGKWASVRDRAAKGLAVDAGIILTFNRFSILAGASGIAFRTLSAELGLGLIF